MSHALNVVHKCTGIGELNNGLWFVEMKINYSIFAGFVSQKMSGH